MRGSLDHVSTTLKRHRTSSQGETSLFLFLCASRSLNMTTNMILCIIQTRLVVNGRLWNKPISSFFSSFTMAVLAMFITTFTLTIADRQQHRQLQSSASTSIYPYNQSGFITTPPRYASMWTPMSMREALSYYTEYELCIISKERFAQPKDCLEQPGNLEYCNAYVASDTNYCGSFEGYLLRPVTVSPRTKTLAHLVALVRSMGGNTVFLVGNSLTSEQLLDAQCSGKRYGFEIKRESDCNRWASVFWDTQCIEILQPKPLPAAASINGTVNTPRVVETAPYFQFIRINFAHPEHITSRGSETIFNRIRNQF